MTKNRIFADKVVSILTVFAILLMLQLGKIAIAEDSEHTLQVTVTESYINHFWEKGREAYQNNQLVYAAENLFVYYQLAAATGSIFNRYPDFQKEVSDVLQYAEAQLNAALNDRAWLAAELDRCRRQQSAGGDIRYSGKAVLHRPHLRQVPPRP